jgi:RHS repeat-associated protein
VLAICDAGWSNIRSASSHEFSYTHKGRRFDPETELYYYRHRMYHAGLGRFASRDPVGCRGGWNLYGYAGHGPLSHADPSGLKPFWCGPLEGLIRSFLDTPEEKFCWNNFVGGTKKNLRWKEGKFGPYVSKCGNFANRIKKLEDDCWNGTRWEQTTETVNCPPIAPFKACIGNFTATITHSCVCGCLRYTVTMNDKYDFDPRFFETHRSVIAELKTIGVSWAQAISFCGWKEFWIKGSHSGGTCS